MWNHNCMQVSRNDLFAAGKRANCTCVTAISRLSKIRWTFNIRNYRGITLSMIAYILLMKILLDILLSMVTLVKLAYHKCVFFPQGNYTRNMLWECNTYFFVLWCFSGLFGILNTLDTLCISLKYRIYQCTTGWFERKWFVRCQKTLRIYWKGLRERISGD